MQLKGWPKLPALLLILPGHYSLLLMSAISLPPENQTSASTVLLPLAYLPPIGIYAHIVQHQIAQFEVFETYMKQSIRNRTTILTANGPLRLTIPVKKVKGNHTKTHEIIIDYSSSWHKMHWRAITSAYNKAPFFLYYKDELEAAFMHPCLKLADFNFKLLQLVNKLIKNKTSMCLTETFHKDYQDIPDLRYAYQLSSETAIYYQVFSDRFAFVPDLGILDLLFNEGPASAAYLSQYKLPLHMLKSN